VLAVTLRDSARAGPVIDAAIASAGDAGRIHWIQHQQSDVDALQARARDAAFADARSKAEQFARQVTMANVTVVFEASKPA
jgi:uncharacterized protein YggE